MAYFDPALDKVLGHEGVTFDDHGDPIPGHTGYVNNPDDPGGETNFGITKQTAARYGYTGSMKDIPFQTVQSIYRTRYWDALRGDEIPDQEIAEEMFDTAVNCGVASVAGLLQRTLNVLNVKGTKYPDIPIDSMMGPNTIAVLTKALNVAPWYRLCILRALDSLQCVHYITLAESNVKFETFMPGWLRTRVGVKD